MNGHRVETPPPIETGGNAKALATRVLVILALVVAGIWWKVTPKPVAPPPTVSPAPPQVRRPMTVVEQFPDCQTPCTVEVKDMRDLYSDGEPIIAIPPGWSESEAIHYSGKGRLVIEGGNIHEGRWTFKSEDPKKTVTVRVFGTRPH